MNGFDSIRSLTVSWDCHAAKFAVRNDEKEKSGKPLLSKAFISVT
jgi:hypothetical protein